MTEVYQRMPSDQNDDSPAKCRERRRRRIKMRRFGAIVATSSEPTASDIRKEKRTEDSDRVAEGKRMRTEAETKDTPATETDVNSSPSSGEGTEKVVSLAATTEVQAVEPIFGTMSVTGRSREMEDAISTRTSLCSPDINWRRPVHFFAVYDGHGGRHVSSLCKEKMHVIMEEELMRVRCTSGNANAGAGPSTSTREEPQRETENTAEWEDRWRRAIRRCCERMDEVAVSTCACGSVGCDCAAHSMEVALSGSTAVVALLTSEHIIVANCGDSRAVLCRAGRAIPLSCDHKPDRPDELARIEASGGRVIFVNGARVEGILAMSRAIGILFQRNRQAVLIICILYDITCLMYDTQRTDCLVQFPDVSLQCILHILIHQILVLS
ncbi:putative protein phosphatase 2C 75 [Citrus sinensis]|uniref:Uncharacterized protein n=1 Tax=Citrus sinensis TaxID=2711 RepID=A0ACB8HTT0_CITSI|nr:putative protein phosphatase 2C 75 [Citrus sinensis]KAH9678137.1 putative protein phosphatase 2C 75 [Citrus sinensis]